MLLLAGAAVTLVAFLVALISLAIYNNIVMIELGDQLNESKARLEELESQGAPAPAAARPAEEDGQVSFLDMGAGEVAQRLRQVDIDTLTPIEAMNLLYELKKKL